MRIIGNELIVATISVVVGGFSGVAVSFVFDGILSWVVGWGDNSVLRLPVFVFISSFVGARVCRLVSNLCGA